jgi:hypothetical protein
MQAFLWRHLVPAKDLLAASATGFMTLASLQDAKDAPLVLRRGQEIEVRIHSPRIHTQEDVELSLSDPPPGLSLADVKMGNREILFKLKDDGKTQEVGYRDNVIVELIKPVYRHRLKKAEPAPPNGQAPGAAKTEAKPEQKPEEKPAPLRRVPVGVLPAIPIVIAP